MVSYKTKKEPFSSAERFFFLCLFIGFILRLLKTRLLSPYSFITFITALLLSPISVIKYIPALNSLISTVSSCSFL